MEDTDGEELIVDPNQAPPPNDMVNELLKVGEGEDVREEMGEFLDPLAEYNEEEEEKKYYRRKRLGVIKNVVAASVGAMIVYGVYMVLCVCFFLKYFLCFSCLTVFSCNVVILCNFNVFLLLLCVFFCHLLNRCSLRFLGTKWMMFLASGIYALFVSTNYWERYYTLVPSAVAIGVAIVPFWASLGNYITRMAQQYYEYMNYKQEHVQEQKKLPKGACHPYIIVFQSISHIIFNLSFVFAELPTLVVLNPQLLQSSHILYNVKKCGADVQGMIPGFNDTVLLTLPHSMVLIEVESVLMGFAFLSMIIFLGLCGAAYRPTEEIDLRSIGWGNIFQLPFKHLRDYRLRLLCPFFIYSGFETAFAIFGISMSYGVCVLGLDNLWLLVAAYGLSTSIFSSLSLCLLRLPRWAGLAGSAVIHGVLLVALLAFSPPPRDPTYQGALLSIIVLWGMGSALNKSGLSIVLGMLYGEEKERLDFVYTIYHWWQAIGIFIVYLWSNFPMRAKLSIMLVLLLLSSYCYLVIERRLHRKVDFRLPRIPRPRHKVKGYRYLEEDNSDESDSEASKDEEEDMDEEHEEIVAEEEEAEAPPLVRMRGGGEEGERE
uniref:Uncharacterized protein n=1 Tax=Gouania willdenowi TaxID=441366 RepID=A0A8C5NE75_GOUWI